MIAAEGTNPGPVVTGITTDLVVDPDDRTVLLADSFGGLTLVRYAVDGSPDPTFGVDGIVRARVGDLGLPEGQWLVPNSMTMQADGSVVVVGSRWLDNTFGYADVVVLRYSCDGALDTAFGDGAS